MKIITDTVAIGALAVALVAGPLAFADPATAPPPPATSAAATTTTAAPAVNWRSRMEAGVATTTTTTTTIPAGDWKCPQAIAVAADYWPADELAMVDRIVWRESRCNADSINWDDPTHGNPTGMGSISWYQVNAFWCWQTDYLITAGVLAERGCEPLLDPVVNTRAAFAIWQRSGWQPWGI